LAYFYIIIDTIKIASIYIKQFILFRYLNMDPILDGTYVINMDSDTTRLAEFDAMMSASDWNYSRFPAVNGKKLTQDTVDEKLLPFVAMKNKYIDGFNWLSLGEVGCSLSHISLWEEVATHPQKNRIAIFEDDARTHADGSTVRRHLLDFYIYLSRNNIPEPDILYLGKSLDDCINYEKVWGNVYKSTHSLCLHAYIITKKGAQKLLSMAPYQVAIDLIPIMAAREKIIVMMTFHPSIYFQDIFNNNSNLRSIKAGINSTTECLISMQHLPQDTWEFLTIASVGLLAAIILFIIYIWVLR
jgi:GR25 family glycosyltransferase involved in LPS biosynthesis